VHQRQQLQNSDVVRRDWKTEGAKLLTAETGWILRVCQRLVPRTNTFRRLPAKTHRAGRNWSSGVADSCDRFAEAVEVAMACPTALGFDLHEGRESGVGQYATLHRNGTSCAHDWSETHCRSAARTGPHGHREAAILPSTFTPSGRRSTSTIRKAARAQIDNN